MKKFIIPLICTTFLLGGCPLKHVKQGYFENHLLSLKGDEESQADVLTRSVVSVMTTDKDTFEYQERLTEAKTLCGERSFFVFVSRQCMLCSNLEETFVDLDANRSDYFDTNKIGEYYVHTIYVDEEDNSFNNYVQRNSRFFELASEAGYHTYLHSIGHLKDSDLEAIGGCDVDNMVVPMVFMVDFSDESWQIGLRGVFIGTSGTSKLADCLLGEGHFARVN